MEALIDAGLLTFLEPRNLVILVSACALAFILGVLPGLSATEAMIILLPFSFTMDLNQSMIMLSAAYASAFVGASLTSILFGIPGSSTNLTTQLDGHPLRLQGRAIFAVSAASTACALGGVMALLLVVLLMPLMEPLSLLFGPAEWFAFVILGLVILSFSGDGPPLRGLMAGALGLLVGTIGLGILTATPRYTFGMIDLWGGVPLIAAFVGLYPLTEALWMARGRDEPASAAPTSEEFSRTYANGQVMEGVQATFRHPQTVFVSGMVGWLVGVVPGVGATLANVLGYYAVRDISRDKSRFGKGDVRGVIAAEASNNASVGGALIPALALGIPGSLATAILLGVFMINGVRPGTNIFTEHLTTTWIILLAVGLSTVLSSAFVLFGAWRVVRLVARFPPARIVPLIVFIGLVATLLARGNPFDLVFVTALAIIGYLMKVYDFSRISFVIALMLGPIVESSFFQALEIGRGSYSVFIKAPVLWVIWSVACGCVVLHLFRHYRARQKIRRNREVTGTNSTGLARTTDATRSLTTVLGAIWVPTLFTAIGAAFAVGATTFRGVAVQFPLAVGVTTVLLGMAESIRTMRVQGGATGVTDSAQVREAGNRQDLFRELSIWVWFFLTILLVFLIGLVPSAFISTCIYSALFLRVSYIRALLTGGAFCAFLWVVFEKLAGFQLYQGYIW